MGGSAAPAESAFEPNADPPPADHPAQGSRFRRHSLLAALLLVGLTFLVDAADVAVPDEGQYSAQAALLARGSWWAERPAPHVDPTGTTDGLLTAVIDGDRHMPYARHPLYPLVLAPFAWALGPSGPLIASALAAWAAAVLCGLVARRLRVDLDVVGLWLAVTASTVVFDALLVIGHSMVVATTAGALLAVDRATRSTRWIDGLTLVASAALLPMIRSEGTIAAAAIGGATALSAVAWSRPFAVERRTVGVGLAVLATTGAAYWADGRWANVLTGSGSGAAADSTFDRRSNPIGVLWTSVLSPWSGLDPPGVKATVALAVLGLAGAVAAHRWLPGRQVVASALLALAAIATCVRAGLEPRAIPGFVPAAPLLALGALAAVPPGAERDRRALSEATRSARRLAVGAVLTLGGIAATTYGSVSTEWGGRFFHVLLPFLAPLAAHGIARSAPANATARRFVVAALIAVALGLAVTAARTNRDMRAESRQLRQVVANAVRRIGPEGGRPLFVLANFQPAGSSRRLWQEIDDGLDVLSSKGIGGLPTLLQRARSASVPEVLLITELDRPALVSLASETFASLETEPVPVVEPEGPGYRVFRIRFAERSP